MSADTVATATPRPTTATLVRRQLGGILRLELRRHLLSRRALVLLFLAFAPVLLVVIWSLTPVPNEIAAGPAGARQFLGSMIELYVRFSVFLSAVSVCMSLFRSELLERTLHYYFLTPVRRETLVAGKYLAALLAMAGVYLVATVLLVVAFSVGWGSEAAASYLFQGPGLGDLGTYAGIVLLGVAGYGAIFLLMGLFFRNPVIAAVIIFGWETLNPFLPLLLKRLSVVYYLRSLHPVPLPTQLFAILAPPASAWTAVLGLLLFTLALVAGAAWRTRRMEVSYGDS